MVSSASACWTASNIDARSVGSVWPSASARVRWVGSSRSSTALPATSERAASGASAASRPNASVKGRYGSALSPKSRQCPTSTRQPAAWARSDSSASSRLLPTPASPPSSTLPPGSPPSPTASARVRTVSVLPTSGLRAISDGIPAIMANSADMLLVGTAVVGAAPVRRLRRLAPRAWAPQLTAGVLCVRLTRACRWNGHARWRLWCRCGPAVVLLHRPLAPELDLGLDEGLSDQATDRHFLLLRLFAGFPADDSTMPG